MISQRKKKRIGQNMLVDVSRRAIKIRESKENPNNNNNKSCCQETLVKAVFT